MCPHKRAFVLDHGVVGDDPNGNLYVSCPLHKRNYKLDNGECLNDDNFGIMAFEVKEEDDFLLVRLPEPEELDEVIGTEKWMVSVYHATGQILPLGNGPFSLICDCFTIIR
jgi:nitrite reductase (NAD(P)H)